jgi:hypothetical protein
MDFNNVERRGATRKVPMEVLGLGFSRTGTACTLTTFPVLRLTLLIIHPVEALRIALEKLGYKETNHGFTVAQNLREVEMWTEAINAKFFGIGKPFGCAEWDQLLGHCMVSGHSYKARCRSRLGSA